MAMVSTIYCQCLVFALAVEILFLSVGHSFQLSSRLIHRFSEEARALRVSKYGRVPGSPWPSSRSMGYYELLARNDFRRQRMKLGAKYDSLYFSEGSETYGFGNNFGWLHYAWVDIGTPNVSFLVALDTGSDQFWVPCDCIQCAQLSARDYGLDRDLGMYSPAESSTSKHLLCGNQLCEKGPKCKSQQQPCPYVVQYLSNDASSGLLVEDTLSLVTGNKHTPSSLVKAPVIIGCGRMQSGSILNGTAPDGILGLGFGDISVPSCLSRSGLVRNSFSLCFEEDDSGRIFFGDQGIPNQQTTPFLPLEGKYETYIVGVGGICIGTVCLEQTGFTSLVDTGFSFTFFPDDVYKTVTTEFDRQINASRHLYKESIFEYCYKVRGSQHPEIPTFTLTFSSNSSFVVSSPIFEFRGEDGELEGICLALQSEEENSANVLGTIGHNFMMGYRLVFDRGNLRLGWSPSTCDKMSKENGGVPENPLPTNQQQSSNHSGGTHSATPAIAVRTPPSSDQSFAASITFLKGELFAALVVVILFGYC
ncbi:aspartic proteinase-like protein 1 [Amborella trichopoda]|uniref:Peptidase A1 domain-containing protein n=1 Tax=Amborella trichopoda TaxID=13333 RepID=W1NGC8_AMBTC|nr:aspartic proteinase-like protein 1 [Amborella trichopoda]ERM94244.1 hypothetical protein AMTR_s00010p00215300 [Amborella trichopoda]|eukprot:XP_006827007.1 aspartic proteinase-like protein 1 [Amborella trichopoda]